MKKVVSGILLIFITVGMLILTFDVQPAEAGSWVGTVYIRSDGSVDPSNAPIQRNGDYYTLTNDIVQYYNYVLYVERDNIVFDGAKYTIRPTRPFGTNFLCPEGMLLEHRSNVTIKNTKISGGWGGITLQSSNASNIINCTIGGDTIGGGIELSYSFNNRISGNKITDAIVGIELAGSCDNNVSENNITNNGYGIEIWNSSRNIIYHNNFLGNTQHVYIRTPQYANFWDDGYPSGGNYWMGYEVTDVYSGPYQNETGSDGIGDKPYVGDRYPLVFPWGAAPTLLRAKSFVSSPSAPEVSQLVTFDASYSLPGWNGTHVMPITEYRWDFGDGNITSTVNPIIVHTYTFPKTFNVTLTVSDSGGSNSSRSQMIKVMMPTSISISTSSPSTLVGFTVNVNGTLHDCYGKGLENELVVMSYTFLGAATWFPISSSTTDSSGHYNIQWIPTASGYFTIKAEWTGNTTHLAATNTITLSAIPYQNQYVFSVESNSTISALVFNATSRELSFTANGPSGTRGYAKVTVAKSLVTNINNIKVYLDGNQSEYSITSMDNSWLLTFDYEHSAHQVVIALGTDIASGFPTPIIVLLFIVLAIITIAIITIVSAKRKISRKSHFPLSKLSKVND